MVGICITFASFAGARVSSQGSNGKVLSTWDGAYTQAQAKSGKQIYAQKCVSCHLDSLEGGVNESPALRGDTFASQWDGKPLRALYSRILSTMPSNDPGSLSERETLDVLAYILERNGFPPGKKAVQGPDVLNTIQFKRTK